MKCYPPSIMSEYAAVAEEIRTQLESFREIPRNLWIYEVLFCILTPQSSPFHADKAVKKLISSGIFTQTLSIDEIADILRHKEHYVRFHNQKARRVDLLVQQKEEVENVLFGNDKPQDERDQLVKIVNGIGYKEASHLLRNIGRNGLAILDRHILRELVAYEVIETLPRTLSRSMYLSIEEKLLEFSHFCGIDNDELDLFIWFRRTGTFFK